MPAAGPTGAVRRPPKADLGALAPVLHAREIRLVGGEPLLHPDVVAFAQFARASGVADKIVLITNGVLLHKAAVRLFDCVDEVRLSVYPQVRLPLALEHYAETVTSRGARFTPIFQDRFYRTLLNQRIDDPEIDQSRRQARLMSFLSPGESLCPA